MLFAQGRKWCNCFIILNGVTFTSYLSPNLSFHLLGVHPTIKAPFHPEVVPASVSIPRIISGGCHIVSLSLGYPFASVNSVVMKVDSTGVTPKSILSPSLFQLVILASTTLGSSISLVTVVGIDDGGR